MKVLVAAVVLMVVCAIPSPAQEQVSAGELHTIGRCVHHDGLNLLGDEFNHGQIRMRHTWLHESRNHVVLFFAFRSGDGKTGRLMEFVVEGKRPNRHFTMVNDANFDGRIWKITSDPLGGVYSHELFPAQLSKLREKKGELRISLDDSRKTEGTCDSYVEPNLSR